MFKKGDYIYYHHRNGDTYPGKVLYCEWQTTRIKYNGLTDDVKATVKTKNLSKQK